MKVPHSQCPSPKESDIADLVLWLQVRPEPKHFQARTLGQHSQVPPSWASHWPRCAAPGTVPPTGRYPEGPSESRSAAPSCRRT